MRQTFWATAGCLALSAQPSLAVPMQAVLTGTYSYTDNFGEHSETGYFPEQSLVPGAAATITFSYDPELTSGCCSKTTGFNFSGGSGVQGSPTSPVTAASIAIGGATYDFSAAYRGMVSVAGYYVADRGYYVNLIALFAFPGAFTGISFDVVWVTYTPSPIFQPQPTASYSISFLERGSLPLLIVRKHHLPDDGPLTGFSNFFSISNIEIAPDPAYSEEPPVAPVPLPAAAPLALSGLAALAGLRRLRRRG